MSGYGGRRTETVDVGALDVGALGRLAGWSYDHRRRVLVGWIVGVILVIGIASSAGSSFSANLGGSNSPSARAQTLLAQRFPSQAGDSAQVAFASPTPLTSAANAAEINKVVAALRPLRYVSGVQSPLGAGASRQLSANRQIGFATVQFTKISADLPNNAVRHVVDVARSFNHRGFTVAIGGDPISSVVSAAPGSSEGIGILAAIIIMLLAFGSVVAMGLPLITALVGVGTGFGVVDLVSHVVTVPTFGPELMAMIGLGVGIDYALFIVTRYRQGLSEGREPRDATIVALTTAGRAVLFAGTTVIISLLGLFIVGLSFMNGLAIGAIAAVLLVLSGSLTLLPALLGFSGRAIDRLRIPGLARRPTARSDKGFWYRWSRTVQRRPWVCGGAALVLLVLLAIPLFSLRLGFSDAGNDPTKLTTRQTYDLLAKGFGPGFNGPLVLAANISTSGGADAAGRAAVQRLDAQLHSVPGVASNTPAVFNAASNAAVIIVYPSTAPQAAQTSSLVHLLRDKVVPEATAGSGVKVLVGGETAAGVDAATYLSGRLPYVIALVILLAFVLLMAVFRSVAIPIKAALMNLLSIGGAYGVIVAVYQWGWLGSVFGVSRSGPIDAWIPLMMFTITFGLSMDYEVFLLSRIREEWRRTGDSSLAVADGLATTARVITAAAAIMICVFGSFVVNDPLRVLDIFGLGLASAILIDATLVRMVLVPSVMELLGTANWWMPAWLDRALPSLGVEHDAPPVPAPAPPRPATV